MWKVLKLGLCILITFICCISVSITVSATSYISRSDKEKIEKLLLDTEATDGNCAQIPTGKVDAVGHPITISIVKFTDGSTMLYNIDKEVSGVVESSITVNEYVGNGFWVMEANYDFVEEIAPKERRIILDNLKDSFNNKDFGISEEAKQMFYNELRSLYGDDIEYIQGEIISGIKPNMFMAYEIFLPFRGWVGTFLGCLVCIIIVSLVFSVVLDTLYIQVPEFRERTFQSSQKGGGGRFSFTRNRTQIERPWFVSYEAARASKESIESNGTRNGLLLYMKYRIFTWIVVVVCITYLITGIFMNIVNEIWDKAPQVFDIATWGT